MHVPFPTSSRTTQLLPLTINTYNNPPKINMSGSVEELLRSFSDSKSFSPLRLCLSHCLPVLLIHARSARCYVTGTTCKWVHMIYLLYIEDGKFGRKNCLA